MMKLPCLPGAGLCAAAVALMASAACGPAFSTTGGTGGASTSSGTGSSTGTGGKVTSSSSSGAPGCTASSCGKGEYCETSSSTCVMCSDLSRFKFGTPVASTVTVPAAGASALYPRADTMGNLYLVQQDTTATHHDQIALATAVDAGWAAAQLVGQLAGTYQDRGPLYVSDPSVLQGLVNTSVTASASPVLLFDSDRILGKRQVFAAILGGAGAPLVLTLPGGAGLETRIAISLAAASPRFWWISNAGSTTEHLVTGTAADSSPGAVPIQLDNGCVSPLADTPWVTPKGERLLFASLHTNASASCAAIPTVTHLYQVALSPDGTAPGEATPIFPNDTNLDTTPSLTPDLCGLLFARFDGQGNGQIFEAPRN